MKLNLLSLRLMIFLGIMSLVLVLSACGQTNEVTPSQLPAPTKVANGKGSTNANGSTSANGQGAAKGQAPVYTFIYKNIIMKVTSVDQQKQFSDDPGSNGPIVVRVNLHEQNPTSDTLFITYTESMRLILPNGSAVVPSTTASFSIAPSIVRDTWLDFSVAGKQDVNNLILRVGTTNEHQMDVPLKSNADLSKYQPVSITPGTKLHYGVDWTVTKVTSTLSADGDQAATGQRYIVVTLQADNSTDEIFFPSPGDNFRMKSGALLQAPKNYTVPGSIDAHSTGTVGTVTFMVPDNNTNLQLQFLAQPKQSINAASANFQI